MFVICIQGELTYEITGVVPAPYFFGVKPSGEVFIKADLRTDKLFRYTVSIDTFVY